MKKLFTLVALLALFLGAKAETVVDLEIDYSTATSWEHGWVNDALLAHMALEEGALHFSNDEAQANFFDYQGQIHTGIRNLDNDASYTITLRIKGSVAQDIHASFSGSNTPGMIPITTEWKDVVLENCVNDPSAQYFANSGCLLIQPGDYVGEFWISYIKITHDEKPSTRPVVWQQWLTDDGNSIIPDVATDSKYVGDAETSWPAWALEEEGGINANWRGDNTGKICAWGLTMGRNFDNQCPAEINSDSYRARPFPADIEVDPDNANNHVYVVRVTEVADIEGGGDGSAAWSNQFWIQSPNDKWKEGTTVRVKFKYKAEKAASVPTQQHKIYPSNYLNGNGIGTISFETTWKDFEGTVTVNAGCASIAFNLTDQLREPNVFYFDDLSWETMVLDEGFFVAASNATTGIQYDYDNAIEFVEDPDDPEVIVATVGTEGNKDSWVNEVMISTVRGQDKAFKGATIKPTGRITGNDPDNWQDYTAASSAKIQLPAAGVWQISIAPEDAQILFMQLEGDALAEPVAIVTNEEEIVINAVEREPTSQEQPADEEAGIPAGTGATWDNQFFIFANRKLTPGEVTVLEFDYSATKEARSTSAWQNENVYVTGAFNLEGDNIFNTEVKHFKQTLTVPAKTWQGNEIDGITFISFDLACIKDANDYTFTNIKWYLADEELNANNQTMENLISATGTSNFKKKIGAGTGIIPLGIINVINNATIGSDVIYNLSGQRVSKDYKGIVIMNGRKVVNK